MLGTEGVPSEVERSAESNEWHGTSWMTADGETGAPAVSDRAERKDSGTQWTMKSDPEEDRSVRWNEERRFRGRVTCPLLK
jgi:hypothetical protein